MIPQHRITPVLILFLVLSLFGCKEKNPYQTTGYVEANLFYLASPTGGYLKKLNVYEGEAVDKGQKLLKLENQESMTAPAYSKIVDVLFQTEEYIPPGVPIMSLLIPSRMKIVFYVPEKNLHLIKIHKKIFVLLNNKKYTTKITYIANQAEFTPDNIFSEKNRYKIVYKIKTEVTPILRNLLKAGQPVDIDYE